MSVVRRGGKVPLSLHFGRRRTPSTLLTGRRTLLLEFPEYLLGESQSILYT